jgi:hypothetical protein
LSMPEAQITTTDYLSAIDLNIVANPRVPVVVTCVPEQANRAATFSCERAKYKFKRPPTPGSWRLKIPADSYDIAAQFRKHPFSSVKQMGFPVRPIYRHVKLKVRP